MIHPSTELRFVDDEIGYGVFATRAIPRGTITWTRDELDRGFTREAVAAMSPLYRNILEKYTFVAPDGLFVLCWDIARFVNHSCEPTCLAPGWDFELAVRDIAAGEQLTDDYGSLNLEAELACRCGTKSCRGVVRPGDLPRHADAWDALVGAAFPDVGRVDQPLWHFVREREEVRETLRRGASAPSCRRNYRPPGT